MINKVLFQKQLKTDAWRATKGKNNKGGMQGDKITFPVQKKDQKRMNGKLGKKQLSGGTQGCVKYKPFSKKDKSK